MIAGEIWLVDDIESNRRLYAEILESYGHQVETFSDGVHAVAAAAERVPDVVLLDVRMPVMDGFECCRALRAVWGNQLVPIVMLTAVDDREAYVRGLESGADDYLVQPVDLDALRVRVDSLLRLRSMHLELEEAREKLAERVDELRQRVAERERQLVMADRLAAVGQMAAAIAHEINNPLTYVSANANFCRSSMPEPTTEADTDRLAALDGVIAGVERIREVIRDVATFSRAAPDNADASAEVRAVIESAVNMSAHVTRGTAELELDLPDAPLHVAIAPSRLAQVVMNLLVNAAHAIEDKDAGIGNITVRAARDGQRATITVTDSGAGIPRDHFARIFDPFYTSKQEDRGTGLGLSICRDLVANAGGAIEVDSTLGTGSTFRITLPTRLARPSPEQSPAAVDQPSARVVIIDDEPLVAFALERMLPRCQCRSFVTVEEAGPHLAGADVILCDLMMPDRSALALYDGADDELRARIVFVTGGAYSQWARELLVRARNPALDKPIDRTALRQAVSRVAAARD